MKFNRWRVILLPPIFISFVLRIEYIDLQFFMGGGIFIFCKKILWIIQKVVPLQKVVGA